MRLAQQGTKREEKSTADLILSDETIESDRESTEHCQKLILSLYCVRQKGWTGYREQADGLMTRGHADQTEEDAVDKQLICIRPCALLLPCLALPPAKKDEREKRNDIKSLSKNGTPVRFSFRFLFSLLFPSSSPLTAYLLL